MRLPANDRRALMPSLSRIPIRHHRQRAAPYSQRAPQSDSNLLLYEMAYDTDASANRDSRSSRTSPSHPILWTSHLNAKTQSDRHTTPGSRGRTGTADAEQHQRRLVTQEPAVPHVHTVGKVQTRQPDVRARHDMPEQPHVRTW